MCPVPTNNEMNISFSRFFDEILFSVMAIIFTTYLSCGCAHVFGDGDASKVEEGDGEHNEGEKPAEGSRIRHLGESI